MSNKGAKVMTDIRAKAISFAALAAANEELNEQARETLNAKTELVRGPLYMMQSLTSTYEGQMDMFPIPGSEEKAGVNAIVDKYKDANGKACSFFGDFAAVIPVGKEILDEKEAIKNKVGEYADPEAWPQSDLADEAKALTTRFSNLVALLRKAVRLHYQLNAIRTMKNISVSYTTKDAEGNETYNTGSLPIKVIDVSDPEGGSCLNAQKLGVGDILNLDVDAAKAAGGSWKDLVTAKKKRAPTSGGNETSKGKAVRPITLATWKDAANEQAAFFQAIKQDVKADTAFTEMLGKVTDDEVLNIGDTFRGYERAFPKVQAKYVILAKARAKAEKEAEQADEAQAA